MQSSDLSRNPSDLGLAHNFKYYAHLNKLVYYDSDPEREEYITANNLDVRIIDTYNQNKWQLTLVQNNKSHEYCVISRGSHCGKNWTDNAKYQGSKLIKKLFKIYLSTPDFVKKNFNNKIVQWQIEHKIPHPPVRTGHSAGARNVVSKMGTGVYFNGSGCKWGDNNINLRTSNDPVTGDALRLTDRKSVTIGEGGHGILDCIAALEHFTEKDYLEKLSEIKGTELLFKKSQKLSETERVAFYGFSNWFNYDCDEGESPGFNSTGLKELRLLDENRKEITRTTYKKDKETRLLEAAFVAARDFLDKENDPRFKGRYNQKILETSLELHRNGNDINAIKDYLQALSLSLNKDGTIKTDVESIEACLPELKEAANRANTLLETIRESDLANANPSKLLLVFEAAGVVAKLTRKMAKGNAHAQSEKELLTKFESAKKLLGFDLELKDFEGQSPRQIRRTIFDTSTHSVNFNIYEIEEAVALYTNKISELEGELKIRSWFKAGLVEDSCQLRELEQRIQNKFRKSTHLLSTVDAIFTCTGVIGDIGGLIPGPQRHYLERAGKPLDAASGILGLVRQHNYNQASRNFDSLREASSLLNETSQRNDEHMRSIRRQIREFKDIRSNHSLLLDPAFRIQNDEIEKQRCVALKSQILKALDENIKYEREIRKKWEKNVRLNSKRETKLAKDDAKCEQLRGERISLREQLKRLEAEINEWNDRIHEEKCVEQYSRHTFEWLKENQSPVPERIRQIRNQLSTNATIVENHLASMFAPYKKGAALTREFLNELRLLYPPAGRAGELMVLLENSIYMMQEMQRFSFHCKDFYNLKNQEGGWMNAINAMEHGAFLANLVFPPLQIVTTIISCVKLTKSFFEEEEGHPNAVLANIFIEGMAALARHHNVHLEHLESSINIALDDKFEENRKQLANLSDQISKARLESFAAQTKILKTLEDIKKLITERLDHDAVRTFQNDISKYAGKIKRVQGKTEDLLNSINDQLQQCCAPHLNGCHVGLQSTFPLQLIAITPAYYTALMAAKSVPVSKEDALFPNLFLFNKTMEQLKELLINTSWHKNREKVLEIFMTVQDFGSKLQSLFDSLTACRNQALAAKEAFRKVLKTKGIKAVSGIRDDSHVDNGRLRFDFYQIMGENCLGAQRFLLNEVFHNNQLRFYIDKDKAEKDFLDKIRRAQEWNRFHLSFYARRPFEYETLKSEDSFIRRTAFNIVESSPFERALTAPLVSTPPRDRQALAACSLGFFKPYIESYLSNHLTLSDGVQTLEMDNSLKAKFLWSIQTVTIRTECVKKIAFTATIVFHPGLNQTQYRYSVRFPDDSILNDSSGHSGGNYLNWPQFKKTLFSINLNITGEDGKLTSEWKDDEKTDGIFKVEDLRKSPPPPLSVDPITYQSRLTFLLNDYYDYICNQLNASSGERIRIINSDNLFLNLMAENDIQSLCDGEYILSSNKADLIPLVFPKAFLDYWMYKLNLVKQLGNLTFVPSYDLVEPTNNADPYQLFVEFNYQTKESPPKEYAKVLVAEIDQTTMNSFKKIHFSRSTTRFGEIEYDCQIEETNVNLALFQFMYAGLFTEGGIPNKYSQVINEYVAPSESAFLGLFALLDKQPKYRISFDSRRYDDEVGHSLAIFAETGNTAGLAHLVQVSTQKIGDDYSEIAKALSPLMEHPDFTRYKEGYYRLMALIRLLSSHDMNAASELLENFLGMPQPEHLRLKKPSKEICLEAFTDQIKKNPSEDLQLFEELFATINELIQTPEIQPEISAKRKRAARLSVKETTIPATKSTSTKPSPRREFPAIVKRPSATQPTFKKGKEKEKV